MLVERFSPLIIIIYTSHIIYKSFSHFSMAIMPPPITIKSFSIYFQIVIGPWFLYWRRRSQCMPHIHNPCAASWQHAVLKAVQILTVDWRHEFASG